MVAFRDLPNFTSVRITAVSTVHSGRGMINKLSSQELPSQLVGR